MTHNRFVKQWAVNIFQHQKRLAWVQGRQREPYLADGEHLSSAPPQPETYVRFSHPRKTRAGKPFAIDLPARWFY